jgi:hypothetical protein
MALPGGEPGSRKGVALRVNVNEMLMKLMLRILDDILMVLNDS